MAKNKKKSQPQQKAPLSPDAYMRKVMRTLPVDKCYVNPDWEHQGMGHVIVVRRRPDNKFAFTCYLVDTFCLGVKDAFYRTRVEEFELGDIIDNFKQRIGLEECSYAVAHNLVLGAVEFAEEGGIEPCREWDLAQYGLDEDSEDIELIEYDYGRDGKHFLHTYTRSEGAMYLPILRQHLGDNFDFEFEVDKESQTEDWERSDWECSERYIRPDYQDYPTKLQLKHPEVWEILCNIDYEETVPVDEMECIAAIERGELIADLSQLARYTLRGHYTDDDDDYPVRSLFHIVTILNTLADSRGLDTLFDIIRVDHYALDDSFGDMAPRVICSALVACSEGRLADLEAMLFEPGITWYNRTFILDALELMYANGDDATKEQIVGIVRRQLETLPERVNELQNADPEYGGFVCSLAISIGDRSLLPLVKRLYDEDLIDTGVCGKYSEVEEHYGESRELTQQLTMTEIYCWAKHFQEPCSTDAARYGEPDYEYMWG